MDQKGECLSSCFLNRYYCSHLLLCIIVLYVNLKHDITCFILDNYLFYSMHVSVVTEGYGFTLLQYMPSLRLSAIFFFW